MSVGRLTFLYPQLLRAARGSSASLLGSSFEAGAAVGGTRQWTRAKSAFPRHGKAVEPAEWEKQKQQQTTVAPESAAQTETSNTATAGMEEDMMDDADEGIETVVTVPKEQETKTKQPEEAKPLEPSESELKAASALSSQSQSQPKSQTQTQAQSQVASEESSKAPASPIIQSQGLGEDQGQSAKSDEPQSSALDAVLQMPAPEKVAKQHPSMSPAPYIHHFDSYSLVKQLQDGNYSHEQATTAMKAIRAILSQNLDAAQESLISKSDVENESYLFTAACSELRTEIKNGRRIEDEEMRQQRTHLQHEVDNLTQSLNQELLTLTDNVRGIFNDRKMTVREEQRSVESAIQQINYKMSIMLSSDSKSEIEGLRWILIRRSVLGILFMAILTLGTLRYATYTSQKRQKEAQRKKKEEEEMRREAGKRDRSSAPDAAQILAAN